MASLQVIPPPVIPVTPAPTIQKFAKTVNSLSLKKIGAYSANPIKLMRKGPLTNIPKIKDGDVLEEVEQIDTTLFQVDIVDDEGHSQKYTIIVPEEDDN